MNPARDLDRPRNAAVVLALGARHLVDLARGRGQPRKASFFRTVLSTARPHFFVFPGAAALAGAAAVPRAGIGWRIVVAVVAMALAWSVGQLLNDVLDIEADTVDAPDRPLARGALSPAEAAAAALIVGIAVSVGTALVHPEAWCLLLAAALLLALYSPAKGVPLLGNVAHAALVAVVVWIGTASRLPNAGLAEVLARGLAPALGAGGLAAIYLQANYEKDRVGDERGGYRTLAHVVGLRASALGRGVAAALVLWACYRADLLPTSFSEGLAGVGLALTLVSVGFVLRKGTERGALGGYRYAIHGTSAGLIALGSPLIGAWAALSVFGAAALLVERAFSTRENP